MADLWSDIADNIAAAKGRPFSPGARRAVGGGSINEAVVLEGDQDSYFVKLNDRRHGEMFEAEYEGLRALAAPGVIRVPTPVCLGAGAGRVFLVMEYIPLRRSAGAGAMARFGRELAALHRVAGERFGWFRDNTIGSTPQRNTPTDDWPTFFAQHRLGAQLELLRQGGYARSIGPALERLIEALPSFFPGYHPPPSLLHGDLWSGNYGMDEHQAPVIFDPAVYYGDREADLAMTELFGGFSADFYCAYREAWPLDPGYSTRRTLYNLYHILNHVNLFGGGYLSQATTMTNALLSETA